MDEILSYKTVFVQNIPATCSNDKLNEVFSVVGPIKECFVVKPKDQESNSAQKNKFNGFVTFHSHDDAKAAVKSANSRFSIDGINTRVTFARKKRFSKKSQNKRNDRMKAVYANYDIETIKKDLEDEPKKTAKPEESSKSSECTVVISGFPSTHTIKDFLNLWNLKSLDLPEQFTLSPANEESGLPEARIIMATKQKALKVVSRVHGITLGEVDFKATLVYDKDSKEFKKSSKKSRLIIRNLSFACSQEDLKSAFERFGNITDVKIPTKPNGQMYGYGFVQFTNIFEAMKAMKNVNMTDIKGRKVAVDWALPREQYQKMNKVDDDSKANESNEDASEDENEVGDDASACDEEDDEDVSDGGNDEDVESDNEVEVDSDEEEDAEEDSEEDDSGVDNGDDEEEKSSYDKELKKAARETKTVKKGKGNISSDVHEGKTVFVRSLSYDTVEEDLQEAAEKFGQIKYCKIVENPSTGLSKGCGFIQFILKEVADKFVETLENEDTRLVLQGRYLRASIAESRTDVKAIMKKRKEEAKEKEDKRSLHLANEGSIRPGTQAAIGLSEVELNKRKSVEIAKRSKLTNQNVFVSTTRLCLHNIPRAVDDATLKKLLYKAAGGGKDVRITESRIMRDRERTGLNPLGRSLGFAFANFRKHEHALRALRELNNNPETFGPDKRPIVEFALENKQALELQKLHRKRQLLKNKAASEGEGGVKTKRQRRLEKRRLARANNAKSESGSKEDVKPKTVEKAADPAPIERKPFQGSTGTTSSGKKLKMMKHVGPKIRHRNKDKILEQLKESKRLNKKCPAKRAMYNRQMAEAMENRKETRSEVREPKPKSSKSNEKYGRGMRKRDVSADLREDREFNSLVEKYTKKFQSNPSLDIKKPKWFNA